MGGPSPTPPKSTPSTVIGFNSLAGTVTVVDVGVGIRRTISTAAFAAAIATFEGMGVAVW
jgi:hypothetical protein